MALKEKIESAGGTVDVGKDPITGMKAVKNAAEIAGTRAAHARDGASVVRFLAWLDGAAAARAAAMFLVGAAAGAQQAGGSVFL